MKQYCFLVILFFLVSCGVNSSRKDTNFSVKGVISNAPEDTYVKLFSKLNGEIRILDSVKIKKSSFSLKANTFGVDFFGLDFSNNSYNIYLLIDSGDNITIHANYDSLQLYSVENSEESALIQQLENKLFVTNNKISNKIINKENFSEDIVQQKQFSIDFVNHNLNSPASIIALSQKFITAETVLPISENYELFKKTEKNLRSDFGKKQFFVDFSGFIKNYEIILNRKIKIKNIVKPNRIVDFDVFTIENKKFNFNDFANGKTVLLVFWSSWSLDCVENNKLISVIEKEYPNVQIVQISLDSDIDILSDTLNKYKFNHVLINDTSVWKSDLVNKYAIEKLPTNILINPKGEIILYSSNINDVLNKIKILK